MSKRVEKWLLDLGLGKYSDIFFQHQIGWDVLPQIDKYDLKELAIPLGDRKRLLAGIAKLATAHIAAPAPSGTFPDLPEGSRHAERRQITVVFCDLVGSTKLSNQLDPEDLSDTIQEYQNTCNRLVKRWGGFVAQYLGDGILAYFGWPIAQENDVERAIMAGLEMTKATSQLTAADGSTLAARVGIATGLVMVGELIGEGTAQQETAIGATPNVAAKIQSLASPNDVLIAQSTHRLCGGVFSMTNLGHHTIPGLENTENLWRVDALQSPVQRITNGINPTYDKIIGREDELKKLHNYWAGAKQGKAKYVNITGESGVGKTHLLQSFVSGITPQTYCQLYLFGSDLHETVSFHPIREALKRRFNIDPNRDEIVDLTPLNDAIEFAGLPKEPASTLVASLLGVHVTEDATIAQLSAQKRRKETIKALVSLLSDTTQDKPLLVIAEDIHWFDPSSLYVLKKMIAENSNASSLIISTSRKDTGTNSAEKLPSGKALKLGSLSNCDARELVLRETKGRALPQDAIDTIISTTDGVPLFVKELTKSVIDSEQLDTTQDGFKLKDSIISLDVPSTLHGSLSARLDRLPNAKPVIHAAAAIGRSFSPDLLGYITSIDPQKLHVHLEKLCVEGILEKEIRPDETRFRFTHALVQETAYQSQLKAKRKETHAQIAAALSGRFQGLGDSRDEVLASHFAAAGDGMPAATHYLSAGRGAIAHSAVEEAIIHLQRGLAALTTLPHTPARDNLEMRIQASIGTALMLRNGWASQAVQDAYLRASEIAANASDPLEALWIMWGAFVSRHVRGRITRAAMLSGEISAHAKSTNTNDAHMIAEMVALQTAFYSGDFQHAIDLCESVRTRFKPTRHRALSTQYSIDLELVALVHQALATYIVGEPEQAAALMKKADETARNLENDHSLSWVLNWGATLDILKNDTTQLTDTSYKRVKRGLNTAKDHGFTYVESIGRIYKTYIAAMRANDTDKKKNILDGISKFSATGAEIALPHFWTLHAKLLMRNHNITAAEKYLNKAYKRAQKHGENWQTAEILRLKARCLEHKPDACATTITSQYQKAMSLAKAQGAAQWHVRAALDLAKYQITQNKYAEAVETLKDALSTCKKARNTATHQPVQELLAKTVAKYHSNKAQ